MANLTIFGAGNMGTYTGPALADKIDTSTYVDPKLRDDSEKQKLEEALKAAGRPYRLFSSYTSAAVQNADVVIFCVPTDLVNGVMSEALPDCKKGALISGQTSRKTPEAETFDAYQSAHPDCGLDYVTIHTMCNPGKSKPEREILGIVKHNPTQNPAYERAFQRAMALYGNLSKHIEIFDSVEEHDTMTANTQINTSRLFLAIASGFAEVGCFPWLSDVSQDRGKGYTSAFDAIKFSLAMRAASLPGHVYREIQFGSSHGKDIVAKAVEVEQRLYGAIVGDDFDGYQEMVMDAKRKIFGNRELPPMLTDEDMLIVQRELGGVSMHSVRQRPNSHFSIIQYAVALAENGTNPFSDLKATTPMYTSLLLLMDRLFNTTELEKAIRTPFEDPSIRHDDLIFHDQVQAWSTALLYDNRPMYDAQHARMRERLDATPVKESTAPYVAGSVRIVDLCRERLTNAIDEGRFENLM